MQNSISAPTTNQNMSMDKMIPAAKSFCDPFRCSVKWCLMFIHVSAFKYPHHYGKQE